VEVQGLGEGELAAVEVQGHGETELMCGCLVDSGEVNMWGEFDVGELGDNMCCNCGDREGRGSGDGDTYVCRETEICICDDKGQEV
jgi:hypothetical protein